MKRTYVVHLSQLATPTGKTARKGAKMAQLTEIADAALLFEDGKIAAVGTTEDVLKSAPPTADSVIFDGTGKCAVPGFVDSHTHFLFGGYREKEFLLRLQGAKYLDLLKAGGGIQSTVAATRALSEEALLQLGRARLSGMLSQGVTTVEGKSGYGLDLSCECKLLRALKTLDREGPLEVVPTYLGAHAVPQEFAGRADDYVTFMLEDVLPKVQEEGLAEFCDVFCEEGVFSVSQARRLLEGAKAMGFRAKLHADELAPSGGAELAAALPAVSADHLLRVSDEGIQALAESPCVATLLPGTAFCMREPYAPARRMIEAGCAVALASDLNPGSCCCDSVPLLFALAVLQMGLSVEEALTALTLNGAAAVGRADRVGSLEAGKQADVVLLSCPSYAFLAYRTGANLVEKVWKKGVAVYERETPHAGGF